MQVSDRIGIEIYFFCVIYQKLDRVLVVEDHLGLLGRLSFGDKSLLKQAFGVQPRVGVALQAARVPGKIDE
ncbi:hypothetical protein [Gloeobacter kilaueensis]|uniref:hypothetical protein n=1 Tax=Gloeobacter kilaueensis TaxID=1416614 RepID=UPI001FDFC2A1|nr:hypothetical protein [Gloeobacter kilaueensis]